MIRLLQHPLRRPLFICALMMGAACPAWAHTYRGMSTQVVIEPTSITATVHVAHQDMVLLAPEIDRDKNGVLSAEEFKLGQMTLLQAAAKRFQVQDSSATVPLAQGDVKVQLTDGFSDKPHELQFDFTYRPTSGTTFHRLRLDPNVFRDVSGLSPINGSLIQGTQSNTVTILDRGKRVTIQSKGKETYETVIADGAGAASANGAAPDSGSTQGTGTGALLRHFFWHGMLHIYTGWDHIFFVLGLAVAARTAWGLFRVITAFTVAHSLTLVTASLGWFEVTHPELVEAIVAISIAYIGIDNIIRKQEDTKFRWAFVFAFGLLHGLTFAGGLKEELGANLAGGSMGLVVVCLLVFNFGIELAQVSLLAVLFPLFQWIRSAKPLAWKKVALACSCLVAFMGTSFLADRTILNDRLPWVRMFK